MEKDGIILQIHYLMRGLNGLILTVMVTEIILLEIMLIISLMIKEISLIHIY